MNVLVACEFSGRVRDAFIALGHNAVSCDLLPSERPGPHIQDDVLKHLKDGWDMMIAHPPCKYLANSGVRWRVERGEWGEIRIAAGFFNLLRYAPIDRIAIENPIQHKYARTMIPIYTQTIQPFDYGHGETKRTCLWLKNLPALVPTNKVGGREPRVHHEPPSATRWMNRSRTLPGIAAAMAEQWGGA